MEIEYVLPEEIEKRSFSIIDAELPHPLPPDCAPIIKRVIHATADFSYADSLYFSRDALSSALSALRGGARIITDTNMAKAGINQSALAALCCEVCCFMADEDVAAAAKQLGATRAAASMDKAAALDAPLLFAIGNAPTALMRLCELARQKNVSPSLVIGAPVGFVNVLQSKDILMQSGLNCIIAQGRKGGSTVAAAIINALLYMAQDGAQPPHRTGV